MKIEVRHDHNIEVSARLIDYIRNHLSNEFERHSQRLTHLEVHLSDENAAKNHENDKKCVIESRSAGAKPVAVTARGNTVEQALDAAIDKLHHLIEHQEGKANSNRHDTLKHQPLMDALEP